MSSRAAVILWRSVEQIRLLQMKCLGVSRNGSEVVGPARALIFAESCRVESSPSPERASMYPQATHQGAKQCRLLM